MISHKDTPKGSPLIPMSRLHLGILGSLALFVSCRSDATGFKPTAHSTAIMSPRSRFSLSATPLGPITPGDHGQRAPVFSDIAFALGPTAQMDGALSWLVRDPTSKDPLLVVLSKDDLSDNVYAIARYLMYRDVTDFPTTNGRRIVKLYRDQRVVIEEGGTSRTAWTNLSLLNASHHIAPDMLQRHQNGRPVHVSGLGDVRVVYEPTRAIK